jgi:hypothetical protein
MVENDPEEYRVMTNDVCRYLERVKQSSGASDALIAEAEDQLALKLPVEYLEFLKVTNGGEGFVGENEYAIFWGVEELASLNRSYEVQDYAPGFLIFGSNGGGEAYGFDTRSEGWPVVRITFVGMDWSEARPMGESFNAFLKRLYGAG